MHTDRSIDFRNVEFTYIRILFRLKMEGGSDTVESWVYPAKQNKLTIKQVLHDFLPVGT